MKACSWESTARVARTVFISSAIVSTAVGLAGCSSLFGSSTDELTSPTDQIATVKSDWLADGLIAIARPVPAPATSLALRAIDATTPSAQAPLHIDSSTLLGFMPLPPTQAAAWLSIDTVRQTVSLMAGSRVVSTATGEGLSSLKPGTYHVAHKQRQPLWHAPGSYFEARGLPVPAEGDRARLRRGALGDLALFIDQNTPIHTGPIWASEIGGIKLDDSVMTPLYEQLEVGAVIEVK